MAVTYTYAYEAFRGKTELIYWDQAKAYNGYTLFGPRPVRYGIYLIDMEGKVVKTWNDSDKMNGQPNPKLLENGNIYYAIQKKDYTEFTAIYCGHFSLDTQ